MERSDPGGSPPKKRVSCQISGSLVQRLPRYYRVLRELAAGEILKISSKELATALKLTDSQVRQDMSAIGESGQRGYGYNVRRLFFGLSELLGVNDEFSAVIIGSDPLAVALAQTPIFARHGILLKGVFDPKSMIVGQRIGGVTVMPVDEMMGFVADNAVDIAVITDYTGYDAEKLVDYAALGGIWNFTDYELPGGQRTIVHNTTLGDVMTMLCCEIKNSLPRAGEKQTNAGDG
ncbi:MAG: redox-sensing transcriptional repressor Rex [Clostridiales bacterium]|nr:redox-sensing transcriptional repressor Rex [Clostridiales bacterium]